MQEAWAEAGIRNLGSNWSTEEITRPGLMPPSMREHFTPGLSEPSLKPPITYEVSARTNSWRDQEGGLNLSRDAEPDEACYEDANITFIRKLATEGGATLCVELTFSVISGSPDSRHPDLPYVFIDKYRGETLVTDKGKVLEHLPNDTPEHLEGAINAGLSTPELEEAAQITEYTAGLLSSAL